MIIDEIGGRFARVTEHTWQSLQGGEDDPSLWKEARGAGWTRQRAGRAPQRFHPLLIRLPLGSADPLARFLAPWSGCVFSPVAVAGWLTVILAALAMVVSRLGEVISSLSSLDAFLRGANAITLTLIFVLTKTLHELAHATMCRRVGARCGNLGILVMCGVPCPYCDVTDVWRQPSAAARAAVMLAGIYVELILAALATFVWFGAHDPAIRLGALNLMVVCGISTLVFNANPLMRYDGYYVLGDLLGSVNLRREARAAFRSVWTRRFAGQAYHAGLRTDQRALLLSGFHLASKGYRLLVCLAIAMLLIGWADRYHARSLAWMLVLFAAAVMFRPLARRVGNVIGGRGNWSAVSGRRRGMIVALLASILSALLFLPLPRYRHAAGWVDAADTTSVFVSGPGVVDSVNADYGQHVDQGQKLAKIHDDDAMLTSIKLRGQLKVARLRRRQATRQSLDHPELAAGWQTLQAAEDSLADQLDAAERQVDRLELRAPTSGTVIPAAAAIPVSLSGAIHSLRDRVGQENGSQNAWCRISAGGRLHAILVVDASQRSKITAGMPVRIRLSDAPERVLTSSVCSVSAIEEDQPSVTRQAAYQVLCPLPAVDEADLLPWVGKQCQGVFHFPKRSLAADLSRWLGQWFRG